MDEQGRNADILQSIVDGTEYTAPPQSRIEDLLLQVKEVIEEGGGTKIRLADVSGAAVAMTNTTAALTWSDPEDIVVSGSVLAKWAGTKVLRKIGSAPESITDGVVVVDSKVKNQYSANGYEDTGLEYGVMYYYRWFPYTEEGVVTDGSAVSVTPARTKITTVPSQSGTLTYDGTEQTASWDNYDSTQLTVSGNTATNAGTHTASFTPTADYMWSDGTTTAKTADWIIGKADANATLSANAVTLDDDHLSTTVTVTNATGAVSVSSGNTALATATYNGSTGVITIASPNQISGTVTVTVSIAESSNYNAGTKTITVSCNYLAIVDWKDGANRGTDEQIKAMIDAADRGEINLSDYWSVGDERTVHLSAMTAGDGLNTAQPEQDVVLVLMNEGYPGTGNEGVHFVWGQENSLSEKGRMNTSDTNSGSWNGCAMRADLNNKYYNALPATFRSCLKQFNVITAQTYNGSTNQTSQDYISLFAEKEIFGSVSYSNTTEASVLSQIEYYKTTANRIKQAKGSNYAWWERSPYSSGATGFCRVISDGNANHNGASYASGVAPFGCI